jgi:hypothetical protein
MEKSPDADTFFNQLLLVSSVGEANTLIASNRLYLTREFIQP